ncbi:hypothetical protein [Streptomyces sp. NBC_00503]|uniref:hypothetical protein n=1 Tax=Streptomyces sp. NBC_00503 TaxID=2903659 RepID=UPI002E80A28C|nr:hypothetical protein [Streptomyces sp. NBC_00503]WUD79422.1 hypothetical protein OG490_01880 [Streptomyces sp. NBC_00503]
MSRFGIRANTAAAIGLAAVGALTLTACNDDDPGAAKTSPPAASSSASASASPSAAPASSAPATGGATGGAGGGETAKAGQSFKIGQPAQFPFTSGSTKGTIALTVTSIEEGVPADLAPFKLGDKVNGMVPFYVRYSVKNTGSTDLSFASVGHIKGLLPDGTEAQDLMVIGKFEKCPNDSLPKGFTNGQSATGCAVALAPSTSVKVTGAEYWGDPFTLGKGKSLTWK